MIKSIVPSIFIGLPIQLNSLKLENDYIHSIKDFFQKIKSPNAIIILTPFWQTSNMVHITANDMPGNFNLSNGLNLSKYQQWDPNQLANEIKELLEDNKINSFLDYEYKIDPNVLSLLSIIYPEMHIPIIQLSLPIPREPQTLLDIGHALASLRKREVLLIGMGNIVHNLHEMASDMHILVKEWALEFDSWIRMKIIEFDKDSIRDYRRFGPFADKAIPNPEYFDPFLFIYGTLHGNDELTDIYSGFQHGTLSLRSIAFSLPEYFRSN